MIVTPPPPHFDANTPPHPAAPPPPRIMRELDNECYRNYFLCKLRDHVTGEFFEFELFDGHPLDRAGLIRMLQTSRIVTFNGNIYDIPMIACALAGFTNAQLKYVSDKIIGDRSRGIEGMRGWQVEQEFNVKIPDYLDHIDLIEVLPGQASLKMYGGRMHCKKMQDLPIEPSAILTREQMREIAIYCGNDLVVTGGLADKFKPEIDLRVALSDENNIDLRSKSDAQIAEALFKQALPYKAYPPTIPAGTQFLYKLPSFVNFKTPQLLSMLRTVCTLPFMVSPTGSTSPHIDNTYIDWGDKQVRQNAAGAWVNRPKEWVCQRIKIGNTVYQMGSGGLHSCEENASHIADENYSLVDVDVVSYYPKIISILRMFPPQIGELFLKLFIGWIEDRIAAKRAGNKRKANGAKTKINGTFGKTGSKYSILFAPSMMIQTTITGQLCLLMLIEMLEGAGIQVVSANTDGVVIKCRRDMHGLRNMIVAYWERITGFETEATEYRALFSRDVNSYMAFKLPSEDDPKGGVKLKGAFAPPEPVGPSWPNPANEICVDAVINYIRDGVPVEQTIRQCADIRKFVTVRNVKGGGVWASETIDAHTVGAKRALLDAHGWTEVTRGNWQPAGGYGDYQYSTEQAVKSIRDAIPRQYLGKAVRWYYGRGQRGHIAYASNGNLVARSEGAKPCMELPDVLPPDIDYAWYVAESHNLLKDINCC